MSEQGGAAPSGAVQKRPPTLREQAMASPPSYCRAMAERVRKFVDSYSVVDASDEAVVDVVQVLASAFGDVQQPVGASFRFRTGDATFVCMIVPGDVVVAGVEHDVAS